MTEQNRTEQNDETDCAFTVFFETFAINSHKIFCQLRVDKRIISLLKEFNLFRNGYQDLNYTFSFHFMDGISFVKNMIF